MGVPVAIGGDNLPSPVEIGLTDLPNIGGASGITRGIHVQKLLVFIKTGKIEVISCTNKGLYSNRKNDPTK